MKNMQAYAPKLLTTMTLFIVALQENLTEWKCSLLEFLNSQLSQYMYPKQGINAKDRITTTKRSLRKQDNPHVLTKNAN